MENLVTFLNGFLSYLLLAAVMGATIVVACNIGIKLRKNKDAKIALELENAEQEEGGEEAV